MAAGDPTASEREPFPPTTGIRDRYVDFLRSFSLLIVVVWHWAFTVVIWEADGPHAGNPIGTTQGFWALTWLLQVMPVFFFVGGFAHLRTWSSVRRKGGGYRVFVARRLRRLVLPAAVALLAALVLRLILGWIAPGLPGINRAIILMISPLWFLGLYVVLVLLTPPAVRLHEAGGEIVLVVMAGLAALVDILRFRYHLQGIELANMVIVWGMAHQMGFFWERLVAAPRRFAWCLTLGGFFALLGLTNMGLYPRSMVGVPGEAISNMGPPTLCIVALSLFQVGVVLLIRDPLSRWLANRRPQRLLAWSNSHAMTVYLWHAPGFLVAYALLSAVGLSVPQETNPAWWLQRPLWILLPALCTIPLLALFRKFEARGQQPT